MFECGLQKSGLTAGEDLHVGDSLSSDVNGAKNVGIKTVWVNRNHKEIKGNMKPDFEIYKLTDISNMTQPINN